MKRLSSLPVLGLLFLGAALAAGPVLAAVNGVPDTVAVASPALSAATTSKGGCTPTNPCAMVTPALSNAPMATPEAPPQPDLPASKPVAAADAPAAPANSAGANPCPPAGARGAFARGGFGSRGGFGGPGGAGAMGRGEGFRRFAQTNDRNGGAENGRGFGGGFGGAGRDGAGRGTGRGFGPGFAQRFGQGRGLGRGPGGCARPGAAPAAGSTPH